MLQPLRSLAASGRVDTDHEHSGARITPLCRGKSRGVLLRLNTALFTRISKPPRSTPMRPTRRSDLGTACRAGRRTSRAMSWWQRWTQSASTVRTSSPLSTCTSTTPLGDGDVRGGDSLPVFDAAHRIAIDRPANPTLPRCPKATATAPRAARASTASLRRSTPCILQP